MERKMEVLPAMYFAYSVNWLENHELDYGRSKNFYHIT